MILTHTLLRRMLICLLALIMLSACATRKLTPPSNQNQQTINLGDIMGDPQKLKGALKQMQQDHKMVLKIARGQLVPVHIMLDTTIVELAQPHSEIKLRFKQEVYLSFSDKNEIQISPDGYQWTKPGNLSQVKRLFRFEKGNMQLGITKEKDEVSAVVLKLSTQ